MMTMRLFRGRRAAWTALAMLGGTLLSCASQGENPAPDRAHAQTAQAARHDPAQSISTTPTAASAAKEAVRHAAQAAQDAAAEASRVAHTAASSIPQVIPRATLFGNPQRTTPRLSRDGKMIAFLAPLEGVMNVWVAPSDDLNKARAITSDTNRGIRRYEWAYNNTHLLYLQDSGGDESWKLYSIEVASGTAKDLTPFEFITDLEGNPVKLPSGKLLRPTANILRLSSKFPDSALITLNNRDAQYHDVLRVNVKTGHIDTVLENGQFTDFVADDNYKLRLAASYDESGGVRWVRYDDTTEQFEEWENVPQEDTLTTEPLGFDDTGVNLYLKDSRGRDTAALFVRDMEKGTTTLLAENASADADTVLTHPSTSQVQAASFNRLRSEWTIVDKSVGAHFESLRSACAGEVRVVSRSLDDSRWIASFTQDNGPVKFYLYYTASRKAKYLFSDRPELENLPLSPMHAFEIKARDGLMMVSYLTLPSWSDKDRDSVPDAGPLPMVLLVHGGPWARDEWGYRGYHQWLANRGYAVLSVNYRGSTGFGKAFLNAGNREWAAKMHDDLLDAVQWSVDRRVAQPDRVAIMGGSYGGYATLVGLTFTPEVFACGVDIVGPSSIVTLLNTIPPHWKPMMKQFSTRVGDHTTPEGRAFLDSRSPLTRVEHIKRPLLIGQGANDPRVKQTESDQIVAAMRERSIPVTYVLFPDEGHGFARPENNIAFCAINEAFLAQHLGGRSEPAGGALDASTAQLKAGGEFLEQAKERRY